MASRRTVLSSAALIAFAALGAATSSCAGRHDVPPRVVALPSATVRALDSSETQLAAAIHGRPALVTLWATWCDACRDELPMLNRVDSWARDRGAVVIGVAVGESLERIASFASSSRVSYMVLVDEEFRFADAIGEKRVPTTLVVDRDGRVVYAGGAVDRRALDAFKKVLAAAGHSDVEAPPTGSTPAP